MAKIDELKSEISGRLAKTNLYTVELPSFAGVSLRKSNILCKNAELPGRGLATSEKIIGSTIQQMVYGYTVNAMNLVFLVPLDYSIREYFNDWMNIAFDQDEYELGYKNEYARQIKIHQLKSGLTVTGNALSTPNVNVDLEPENIVYSCRLDDAFPTSVDAISLSNEADGYAELPVEISYTNWKTI